MTDRSNASATLRGFRNQFLYVLYRLLTDEEADKRIYRPEGSEDLAVYDASQTLIESSQVKDYSSDLALSALSPKSKNGFISRYHARLSSQAQATTRLVSFGPLGPELAGAIRGDQQDDDQKHRESVVKKICDGNNAISDADAAKMLDGLQGNVEHPDPEKLRDDVIAVIEGTLAGGHSESTLELLMYWVFDASEHQRDITKQGLLTQIEAIGEYLAALRDTSIEWGVSVCSVTDEFLSDEERNRLVNEYQLGIQAGWKHILANADCPRPERLTEIHHKLREKSVVILRGASGQGKSTLGWRYLHEYCAEGTRFHVTLVEGREHAMRIANALESHVKSLRLDVVVYVDVAPHDSGWEELVRGLTVAGLKVLVTIREEDFRRSTIDLSKFDYAEVVLDGITPEEARPIYESLRSGGDDALDFDEIWGRFTTKDDGPLMEFTHLITQGETLESKIESQVARLRRDANSGQGHVNNAHLHLLAIASIANSAEARVDYLALCSEVGLDPISNPLEVLEHEYLLPIRFDGSQTLVTGVHSLRSLVLERALVPNEHWVEYANRALGVVADGDIERFLLCVFSRHPDESESIENSVRDLSLQSWTHAGGICRALIWLGLSRYEQTNSETLQSAIDRYGDPWQFCCDVYVGFDGDDVHERFRENFAALGADIPRISITPKTEVFLPFVQWSATVEPPPNPTNSSDWQGAGDVAYWVGRHEVAGSLREALNSLLPEAFEKELSIDAIAAFVSGRCMLGGEQFAEWHDGMSSHLKQQFNKQSDSICVIEDDEQVKVYFAVTLRDESSSSSEVLKNEEEKAKTADWHTQTMARIRLIRDLFPAKQFYASQAIGLEPYAPILDSNPTVKRIPIENLHENRAVQLNAVFMGLVSYRHNRLTEWREYSARVLEYRRAVCSIFRKLYRTWEGLLSANAVRQNVLNRFPTSELEAFRTKLPMLPKKAVDEWGFASEGRSEKSREENSEAILRRFALWLKSSDQYARGIENVLGRIVRQTKKVVGFKTGRPLEDTERDAHLIVVNLAESWKSLKLMQREFRKNFGRFHSSTALDEIERYELINFNHLWASAIAIRHGMNRSGQAVESESVQYRQQFLERLHSEVAAAMEGIGSVEVMPTPWTLDEVDHLRIICNHDAVVTIATSITDIIKAIWRAFHFREWDDFEWEPIAVEWQKIAIIHQVRERSLGPDVGFLHTDTLFLYPIEFEVKDFHRTLLPIDKNSFLDGGCSLWDTPLLNAAFSLNASMLLFVATFGRLPPLIEVLGIESDDMTIETAITRFSNELDSALMIARQSKTDLEQLLRLDADDDATRIADGLDRICDIQLVDFDMSGVEGILGRFSQWLEGVERTDDEFGALITELMEYSIREK